MTVISDINQTWPDAIIDIGPIELTDHYWGIVGSIPYDGHVVLAVITPRSCTMARPDAVDGSRGSSRATRVT